MGLTAWSVLERNHATPALTLKGFRGIRDGLGLDVLTPDFERLADGARLVAIAGANGRGKATVMERAQPLC